MDGEERTRPHRPDLVCWMGFFRRGPMLCEYGRLCRKKGFGPAEGFFFDIGPAKVGREETKQVTWAPIQKKKKIDMGLVS